MDAQVGINTEKPEADLEVKGSVRLREIDSNIKPTKVLLANNEGDLGYVNQPKDNYQLKDVFFKMLDPNIIKFWMNGTGLPDLELDITIEIEPYTSVAIAVDYNIPVTMWKSASSYTGITLMRINALTNVRTELDEGSRKYTSFETAAKHERAYLASLPITGKATDIVENNTANKMVYTYSVIPYIEIRGGVVYFGDFTYGNENFGTGIFIAQVYEKKMR